MKPIPKPIFITTGDQEIAEAGRIIDDFLIETKNYVQRFYGLDGLEWKINSGELAYTAEHVTDDRVTYLSYRDIVIANIFETRNELNNINYTFFRNLDGIKELVSKK